MLQPGCHTTCVRVPCYSFVPPYLPAVVKNPRLTRCTISARTPGALVCCSLNSSQDGMTSSKDSLGPFTTTATEKLGNGPAVEVAASMVVGSETTSVQVANTASNSSKVQVNDSAWRWEESDDAVRAYGALVVLLALGNLPLLQSTKLADLPYFVGLAVVTIYIGAHRGLTTRQRQQISIKEGILAPVFASISLFGFYLLIKYLPDFNVQAFLNAYFWMLGTFAIGSAAVPVLRRVGGQFGDLNLKFDVPEGWLLDEDGSSITKAELAPTDLLAIALALGLSTAELASGHSSFTLNNLIATLVATDILQLIGPRSFRTAGLLLVGLLLYDVFWVFGSPKVVGDNVMLAVATSDMISGPTRILFPRIPGGGSTAEAAAAAFPFSLLGLGDIAIPGLLACLALRYDASRSTDMRARAVAAAEAISSALAALDPRATSRQIADATADAAEAGYDRIADQEARQRTESLDGTNFGGSRDDGTAAATAAVVNIGTSLLRGVSVAAGGGIGGSAALGAARSNLGASASSVQSGDAATVSPASSSSVQDPTDSKSQPHLPVSDAVLYQRTYFTPVMFAYVLGLVGAFIANDVTGLGQPALLYIVPATLGAVVLMGVQRGELGRLWSFTDVPSYGLAVKDSVNKGNQSASESGGKKE